VLEYMQNAEPGWRDIPLTTRSGEVLTTSWANVRLSDGSQIGIGIDVTDQRAAQRRIEAYQEELRELVAEVAQAEEMERRRIATALHDQMAQILALTKMRLEEASDRTEDEALAEQIEQSVRNLDKCIRSTRSLVFDLSPPVLYQVGLEAALEHLCDRMREDYDMEGCFCSDGVPLDLSEELKVVLYQAARELMVNVVKHAHAQNMDIDIETIDGELHLTIADDGVGLERVPDTAGQQGFGLFNIRERLGRFGGRLELDENPGCGSIATLIVPLDQETSAEGGNNQ
jgi:signal transduction histidine kinase